ncbi:hypothetical protein [Fodinicola feengrottensis]|uniref:hypothetical protein n=1 Tax=Fodinicola feengrottensis TaxID=435914 RepID=UPI002443355C|nr:hypothetical protein [Fodinicola feengrottensis]
MTAVATSMARPATRPSPRRTAAPGPLLWVLPPLLILLGVVGYPLVMVVRESFLHRDGPLAAGTVTAAGYTGLLSSSTFVDALFTTVKVAVTATIGCLVLGAAIARSWCRSYLFPAPARWPGLSTPWSLSRPS